MKQLYSLIIFLISFFSFSQNFTDTKGELQISASGTATYTLPIAVPPSIKNTAPVINLTYSSGVRGGIAGQGWSINSISAISRIATRRDIDDYFDGVDFDADDKLALDGQRLIVKTGSYWAAGSTYETEYKSNTKIELKTEGTLTYFIVTAPDGSRSWYGSKGSGSLQNSVSLNSWYIVHYEDPNGNFIDYNYKAVSYNGHNQLYIDTITFSGNTDAGISAQNKISFNYRNAKRVEKDYLKGVPVYASQILENIQVHTNNSLFRRYNLLHTEDTTLGYERVNSIQELNAQSEASNPVTFTYESSPTNQQRTEKSYTNTLAFAQIDYAADFDGDGRLDFAVDNKVFTNLFNGSSGNAPISLPFTIDNRFVFTATSLTANKLNQFNSIFKVEASADRIDFKSHKLLNNVMVNDYTKTVFINNSVSYSDTYSQRDMPNEDPYYVCNDFNCYPIPSGWTANYTEGDFNGDGVSEVLIEHFDNEVVVNNYLLINHSQGSCGTCSMSYDISGISFYMLDLNPNMSTDLNSRGFHKINNMDSSYTLGNHLYGSNFNLRKYVADFNGDGKSDILLVNYDKTFKIISFKQLAAAPWTEVEIIGTGTLDQFSWTKPLLFGDYDGDGKADIMIPSSEGGRDQAQWNIYYSNPNPAGGSFFVKEIINNIVEYWPDTGDTYNTQRDWSNYYAMDVNGDGKSDLVRVRKKYYKPSWTINNHNTEWQVTAYANNIGKVSGTGFNLSYDSGILDSKSPDIPIPVTSNYKYQGANTDLVLVRGNNHIIEYYQFNKNVNTENRLKTVTESSGNIVQTIEYKPMEAIGGGLGIASSDFYSSENSAVYPNIEVIRNSQNYLVSKLTATINGISKYQDFRYRSYVSNCDYGPVGFMRTTKSSWYLSPSDTKIWSTQYNDIALRGANTISWSSTNSSTVFDTTPGGLLSTKTSVFATYTNPISKVFNVLLSSVTNVDVLSGVNSENTFTYDGIVSSADYYGLETQSISKSYNGATLQGSTTVDTQYDNNPAGAGNAYYIGRPKKVNASNYNIGSGDIRTSEVLYTYTGNNLTKTEKKGHNTYTIVEDMTYDVLGNLLTKTVSAPTAVPVPIARTITDEYDTTKRFVVKKTDHQGFVTSYAYNNLGQVSQSTDYLGVINNFTYDNWGKLTNTAVTGSSATPLSSTIVYTKLASGGYTTTTTNNLDAKTAIEYDVLGRVVKNSTKAFAVNTMISKQIIYDGLGRKQKESEPYFSAPNMWSNYEYDYLMRPTKVTSPTGKIQTLSYSGLTTTSIDDGKLTTATLDALGNKIQSSDPGGAINFTYFANGQLKESDYQGNKVKINIDGWGNKILMIDPSAGTYTYSYDAFGQLKTETTPNGTSSFDYDAAGKLTQKTIVGTNTDSKTTYIYNSLNQITSSTFVDNIEGNTTSIAYEYDILKRLFKTTETNPYAIFVKQLSYDTLGRVENETSTAMVSGKTSSKTVKNTYQNGFPWQILDDTSQQVLWQTNNLNERGQVLTAAFGNDIAVTNTYDQYGYVKQIKHDKINPTVVNIMTLNTDFEIKRGNLNSRTNSLFSRNETFTYDGLDRLTEFTNVLGIQETQSYDDKGRITQNSIGTYEYDGGKTYQNNSITLTPQALNYYENRSLTVLNRAVNTKISNMLNGPGGPPPPPASTIGLEITYNTFKSPVSIRERGGDESYIDYIDFTYNAENNRSSMFYGGLEEEKLMRTLRKHYSADGTMEVKHNTLTGDVEFVTYIGGDGYDAPVVIKGDGISQNYLYLHRDYQGTIIAVSDHTGAVVEKRLFDAWGNIAEVQDGAGNQLAGLTILDRGYTGHEHLQSVNIIHMNGRLYDPKLHRFLQPDNYIQEPSNTQNYNKYSYVLNNPLKYTDPSGEEFVVGTAIIIGAAVAALTYTITALVSDVPFTIIGLAKATFVGAVSAGVTFGIGSAATSLFTNFYSQAAFQAVAHGTFQGGVTAVSGGKFWSGFAAGALSSIAASAWTGGQSMDGLGKNANAIADTGMNGLGSGTGNLGTIAFGTVAGGAGAYLTGGNFWQGAVTGLFVSGLNHAMHKMQEKATLDGAIRKGGYGKILDDDPYLNWSNEEIGEFASKVFPDLYESANCPIFEKQTMIGGNSGIAGQAQALRSGTEGNYTIRSLGKILIRSNVLNSIRHLGSVVGHELNHMTDYVNGAYAGWINQYGREIGKAYSEVKAYGWEQSMGSSYFNPAMYNHYLNLTK